MLVPFNFQKVSSKTIPSMERISHGQPRRSNIKEFLDVHAVQDADEQEVLWVAVAALCSWNQE